MPGRLKGVPVTTFVSLSKPSRFQMYAKPTWNPTVQSHVLRSKWGMEVHPMSNCCIELLSGTAAKGSLGSEVESLGPTQRGRIHLCDLEPSKYQVMVVVNPALQEVAAVQAPQLVEPGERVAVSLYVHAHKTLRMSDVQWLARLYLVE